MVESINCSTCHFKLLNKITLHYFANDIKSENERLNFNNVILF
jgi:hypothetical protein